MNSAVVQNTYLESELKEARRLQDMMQREIKTLKEEIDKYKDILNSERVKQYEMFKYTQNLEQQNMEMAAKTHKSGANESCISDNIEQDYSTLIQRSYRQDERQNQSTQNYQNNNHLYLTSTVVAPPYNNSPPKDNEKYVVLSDQAVTQNKKMGSDFSNYKREQISSYRSKEKSGENLGVSIKSSGENRLDSSDNIEEQLKNLKDRFAVLCNNHSNN